MLESTRVKNLEKQGSGGNGKSAYEIAVDNGFAGTEIQWLASLKGVKGEQGEQGIKGNKGEKGDKGNDGEDGKSFTIHSQYATYAALLLDHPTGNAGDAYFVGTDSNPDLYVWLSDTNEWYNSGKIAGVKGDKGDKGDKWDTGDDGVPVGTIISFMGTKAPINYLICDGTVYDISKYKVLSDFINEQFGSYNYFGGDGTTTFAVPDLRGEFLRGTGTNSHTNQGSGSGVGKHQDGTYNQYILSDNNAIGGLKGTGSYNRDSSLSGQGTWIYAYTGTVSATTIAYYTSRPTNTSVLYCIKYI